MSEKYNAGDFIVYDVYGICKIERLEKFSFSKAIPKEDYYVLHPINAPTSTYYVPVTGEVAIKKLRRPMSEIHIKALLLEALNLNLSWIEKRQQRTEYFYHVLSEGISAELICLIGCLYKKREELLSKGKKLSSTDENFFKAAENMVKEEFSFSLGIPDKKVSMYIHNFMINPEK